MRTRIVPPLITNDGDGLDAYRVDTYTPPIDLLPHQAVLVMTRGPRSGSYCVVDHEPGALLGVPAGHAHQLRIRGHKETGSREHRGEPRESRR